jgi:hypothetical protein
MGLSSQCGSAKAVCKAAQPSGKQAVIGVAILVESNAPVSSRRLPKHQIRDYRKVDRWRGLGRKSGHGKEG